MALLTESDLKLIKNFVAWPRGFGYVLDHSDRTFSDLFQYEFGVNIDDERFHDRGGSKGNRLVCFCQKEPVAIVARVLKQLWADANESGQYGQSNQFEKPVLNLIERLEGQDKREILKKTASRSIDLVSDEINIPEQDPVIHLAIDPADGRVAFDRRQGQSDADRLQHVLPGMWRMINEAQGILQTGNVAYGFLCDALDEYLEEIKRPPEDIDFGMLQMLSRQLEKSLGKAREKHADPEFPDLPDKAEIKTETVLDLHGSVMAASEVGEQLIIKTEEYNESAEEMQAMAEAISDLQGIVAESDRVFKAEVKSLIVDGLDPGNGKRETKQRLFSRGLAKNIGIVAAYGGLSVGVAMVVPPVGVLMGIKTPSRVDDALSEVTAEGSRGLKRLKAFTIRHKDTLRRTTTLNDGGRWFELVMSKITGRAPETTEEAVGRNVKRIRNTILTSVLAPQILLFEANDTLTSLVTQELTEGLQKRGYLNPIILNVRNIQEAHAYLNRPALVTSFRSFEGWMPQDFDELKFYFERAETHHVVYVGSHDGRLGDDWKNVTFVAEDLNANTSWDILLDILISNNKELWAESYGDSLLFVPDTSGEVDD